MAELLQPIQFAPGFDKRTTSYAAEGRWVDGDKVRSVGGIVETMGGWDRLVQDTTFEGKCRGLLAWRDNDNVKRVAIGTHRRLYLLSAETVTNITPLRASGSLTGPFTTAAGSPVVTVAHTNHGLDSGTYAIFSGAAAVGGITIDGEYVVTVVDGNSYTITHSSNAGAAATGGGTVGYQYEINVGQADNTDAFGFGVGKYGEGTYGTVRSTSVLLRCRTWSLDTLGENLIACPRGGDIYEWDPDTAGRAAIIANAPAGNLGIFVTNELHIVALAAGGDKMRVAWCDPNDNTVWTAAAANQAGAKRLKGGSEILAGGPLRAGVYVIQTDSDTFRMSFVAQEPFFTFFSEGEGSGIVGPNAMTSLDGIAYWMGNGNFYFYDGFVRELPQQDDIRDFVFEGAADGLDTGQLDKVFCFTSTLFREIWWLYQSAAAASGEVDRYVLFNLDEGVWYTGTMARTAWIDKRIFAFPYAAADDGYIYQHESGEDDRTDALRKFITSAPVDLGDGARHMEVLGILPDFDDQAGDVTLTVMTRDHPQGAETSSAYTLATGTDRLDLREGGRQVAMTFESDTAGGKFRFGRHRLAIQPTGRRR